MSNLNNNNNGGLQLQQLSHLLYNQNYSLTSFDKFSFYCSKLLYNQTIDFTSCFHEKIPLYFSNLFPHNFSFSHKCYR